MGAHHVIKYKAANNNSEFLGQLNIIYSQGRLCTLKTVEIELVCDVRSVVVM
jgi:hypothetical protein